SNTQVSEFPVSICQLAKLKYLAIDHNQLTTFPEAMEQLAQLKTLKINGNPWLSLPTSLLALPKLIELVLDASSIDNLKASTDFKQQLTLKVQDSANRNSRRDEFYRRIGK
ncbi:MAG: hypothetical protein AAGJ18_18720, partial [Bacteroidota bacterium]